ncbi:MmcQ/YjbR family DNA-binding protein [Herbiconiux sp. CPCC 205763]|uniref:MmcQ/YjbR family DNA-binding protein n=1 Tax=Herbiconiux aconitum TaxID=2970913 RepID=A0ABT2GSE5_9MICO|nr:MmcQ/YjbR family DNA-binding protein [Herbiconiux aconitum]MCS5717736.1 MmcQ/YjbR family DNA-binding protein [Herbiconiux aconitum]
MTVEQLRNLLLSLDGVAESRPFKPDRAVFKIEATNRVFAILSGHEFPDPQVTVKVEPGHSAELQLEYESVRPGYHMNKRNWVNVSLVGDVPDDIISVLAIESFRMVRAGR